MGDTGMVQRGVTRREFCSPPIPFAFPELSSPKQPHMTQKGNLPVLVPESTSTRSRQQRSIHQTKVCMLFRE